MSKQNRNTRLFLGLLFLAGAANVLNRIGPPAFDKLMTCINDTIYVGLLLFWIQSVRERLLPSRERGYIIGAAHMMLFYMLLRIFKYRFAMEPLWTRYASYAYWIPMMLIPALFLMTCICIRRGCDESAQKREGRKSFSEALLLIPGALLALAVMTNDFHELVYVSETAIRESVLANGTYGHGPLFYVLYVWMVPAYAAGLFMLYRTSGRLPQNAVRLIACVVILWSGLSLINTMVIDKLPDPAFMFKIPEIQVFCMLAIYEICIRFRLIPYNENYSGFFSVLKMPILITDRSFKSVYQSGAEVHASDEELRTALFHPVALAEDRRLYGEDIYSGYAFWVEDESGIRHAQDKLTKANEMIEQENELLRAETEQKEKNAYLASRHRIYHEIAAELYPYQQRIAELLDAAHPGEESFRQTIISVSVLNAFVKRKSNLLLLAAENKNLSTRELFLALQESGSYLTLAGLHTTADVSEDILLPAERIIALYDTFEGIAEQLVGKASSLMVSWNGVGLTLAAGTDFLPETAKLALPVHLRKSEDILYVDIRAREEEAA